MTTKTCTKCKETKATAEFVKRSGTPDGRRPYCSACNNMLVKVYRSNPEDKAKRAAHNVRLRELLPACALLAQDATLNTRRRSDLSSADLYGGLSFTEACAMTVPFVEERLRLEAETGVAHHIDHIIPLSAGGTHTKENLQVLTAQENIAKGAN